MAKVQIKFTVKAEAPYWIAIGESFVDLVNGKGTIELEKNKTHRLYWWFQGEPRGKLEVVGKKLNGKKVVEAESSIPTGESEGGGYRKFTLE